MNKANVFEVVVVVFFMFEHFICDSAVFLIACLDTTKQEKVYAKV